MTNQLIVVVAAKVAPFIGRPVCALARCLLQETFTGRAEQTSEGTVWDNILPCCSHWRQLTAGHELPMLHMRSFG
jgi:hypothetical protein